MSEKEKLISRLYQQKGKSKGVKLLKPKHPKQLGPASSFHNDHSNQSVPPIMLNTGSPTFLTLQTDFGTNPLSFHDEFHEEGTNTGSPSKASTSLFQSRPMSKATMRTLPQSFIPVCSPSKSGSKSKSCLQSPHPEFDVTKYPIFRLKMSNYLSQDLDSLETFKTSRLFSSIIPDDLWQDPYLIFHYIRVIQQKSLQEEFLYFHSSPATNTDPPNYYFLRLVPPSSVDRSHYYTLSTDGITTYRNSKSEFCPLEKWILECSRYLELKNSEFFVKYEKWRSFSLLQSITRRAIIQKSKNIVSDTFFNGEEVLRHSLLVFQQHCQHIIDLPLVDVKFAQTLTLKEFIEKQLIHSKEAQITIDKFLLDSQKAITQACDITYERAGTSVRENQRQANIETKPDEYQVEKKKPQKKVGLSEMMVYTQLATQSFCNKRLSRFLRLCDYILIRELFQAILKSVQQLADFCVPRLSSTGGDVTRLSTTVIIANDTLSLSPSAEEMIYSITSIWQDNVLHMCSKELFSTCQSLKQYSQSIKWPCDVVPLQEIIKNDSEYQNIYITIKNRIIEAYKQASEEINLYKPFLESYYKNTKQFNIEKLIEGDPDASFFSKTIKKFSKEIKDMDSIPHTKQVNILLVVLGPFAETIKPSPVKCLKEVKEKIPLITKNRVDHLTLIVSEALLHLHKDPPDITDFVNQLELRRKLSQEIEKIRLDYQNISELVTLMSSSSISFTDDYMGEYRSLGSIIAQLDKLIVSMKDEEDIRIKKWTPSLSQLVKNVRSDILSLHYSSKTNEIMSQYSDPDTVIAYLLQKDDEMQKIKIRVEQIQHFQKIMIGKASSIEEMDEVSNDLKLKLLLWTSNKKWNMMTNKMNPLPFTKIDISNLTIELQGFSEVAQQLQIGLPEHPLVTEFSRSVSNYVAILPAIESLLNKALLIHHWNKIKDITGLNFADQNYSLQFLFDHSIVEYVNQIRSVSSDASNEAELLSNLHQIELSWSDITFTIVLHKEIKDLYVIDSIDSLLDKLEESYIELSVIKRSSFVGAIKSQVDDISKLINLIFKCVTMISQFQTSFCSLIKIFFSSDIQRELNSEMKELSSLEKDYKNWIQHVQLTPKVYKLLTSQKVSSQFEVYVSTTEKLEKSLMNYLNNKRAVFPRFFFLSNNQLLSLYSESRNLIQIQPYLSILFSGVYKMNFSKTGQEIGSISSIEGEQLELLKCQAVGSIESWMASFEKSIRTTYHRSMRQAYEEYDNVGFSSWVISHPSQVVSIILQVHLSYLIEELLSESSDKTAFKKVFDLIDDQNNKLLEIINKSSNSVYQISCRNIITILWYYRNTISSIIQTNLIQSNNYEWIKQIRYSWDDDTYRVIVHHSMFSFSFGYEYYGPSTKLIITPDINTKFALMSDSLHLLYGIRLVGPGGSGKSSIIEDYSRSFGSILIQYYGHHQISLGLVERIMLGACATGAWICFNSFFGTSYEIMSITSDHIFGIRKAIAAGQTHIDVIGRTINLNPRVAMFLTSTEFVERTRTVPPSFLNQFRSITIDTPSFFEIAEILLLQNGFSNCRTLAKSINLVLEKYRESSVLIKNTTGINNIIQIIHGANTFRNQNPEWTEEKLIEYSIDQVFIRKIRRIDPKIDILCSIINYEPLLCDSSILKCFENDFLRNGLVIDEGIMSLASNLYTKCLSFAGVVLLGSSGTGKTEILKSIGRVFLEFGTKCNIHYLYQHSIPHHVLYGSSKSEKINEQKGLIGDILSKEPKANEREWIVFDGAINDFNASAIESILYKKGKYILPNYDLVNITSKITLFFETDDISKASPSIISQSSIVFFPEGSIKWEYYSKKWISSKDKAIMLILDELFVSAFGNIIRMIEGNQLDVIRFNEIMIITSFCSFFDSIFYQNHNLFECNNELLCKRIYHLFSFCLCWSIGALLKESAKGDFDIIMREIFERKTTYPQRKLLFDYCLSSNLDSFIPWSERVNNESKNNIIYTTDVVRVTGFARNLLNINKAVFIIGENGSGKSTIIKDLIFESDKYEVYNHPYCSLSTSYQLQLFLESKLVPRKTNIMVPQSGKTGVLVVDGLNPNCIGILNSISSTDFLRGFLSKKGYFNCKSYSWNSIENVSLLLTGQSTTYLPNRLMRQFVTIALPQINDFASSKILFGIIGQYINGCGDKIAQVMDDIVQSSILLLSRLKQELIFSASRHLYIFNLHSLVQVFSVFSLISPKHFFDQNQIIKIWSFEIHRVFYDRLIDDMDRQKYSNIFSDVIRAKNRVKDHVYSTSMDDFVWSDLLTKNDSIKEYSEAPLAAVLQPFYQYQGSFRTQLFIHKEFAEGLIKLSRILRKPSGHIILFGDKSVGKRTIVKFACYSLQKELYEPINQDNYYTTKLRSDLQYVIKTAGVSNKPIVLMLNNSHIKDPRVLYDIYSLLLTGEVPFVFDSDEFDTILNELVIPMRKAGESLAYESLCNKFYSNVKKNLHLVITLDSNTIHSSQLYYLPDIIDVFYVIKIESAKQESLNSICTELLNRISCNIIESSISSISDTFIKVSSLMNNHLHKNSLEENSTLFSISDIVKAITVFSSIFIQKYSKFSNLLSSLEQCSNKFKLTSEKMSLMSEELQQYRPQLSDTSKISKDSLEVLNFERQKVAEIHRVLSSDEEVLKRAKDDASKLTSDTQFELDRIFPLLQVAISAIEDLKSRKSDMAILRTTVNPHPSAVDIMEIICLLFGRTTDWITSKQLLSQPDFLNQLLSVHDQPISDYILNRIRNMAGDPKFEFKKLLGINESIAYLFKWVASIEKYSTEHQKILPKLNQLSDTRQLIKSIEERVRSRKDELKAINDKLVSLQQSYDENKSVNSEMQLRLEQCETRLRNAQSLVNSLEKQKEIWESILSEIGPKQNSLIGDTILASMIVTNFGMLSRDDRKSLLTEMIQILGKYGIFHSQVFHLRDYYDNEVSVLNLLKLGFPDDEYLIENFIILEYSCQWPLIIDPHSVASHFLQSHLGAKIIKMDDPNFVQSIESCMRLGLSIIIEDFDISNIKAIQFIVNPYIKESNGKISMLIADKWIEYESTFKIVFISRMDIKSPGIEEFNCFCTLDFSLDRQSIENILLCDLCDYLYPEVQKLKVSARNSLYIETKQHKELSIKLIESFCSVPNGFLDDDQLITQFNNITQSIQQSTQNITDFSDSLTKYLSYYGFITSFASKSSKLFYALQMIQRTKFYNQFSYPMFLRLLCSFLTPSEDATYSIDPMNEERIIYSLFCIFANGLPRDNIIQLGFVFSAIKDYNDGLIEQRLFENLYIMPNCISLDGSSVPPNVPIKVWSSSVYLSQILPEFQGISDSLSQTYSQWKAFIESVSYIIPEPYGSMSGYHLFMISKFLCTSKVIFFVEMIIKKSLGINFLKHPVYDMGFLSKIPNNDLPVLIVFEQDDPRLFLEKYSTNQKSYDRLVVISLTEMRSKYAIELINNAKVHGQWVFIQNCDFPGLFNSFIETLLVEMVKGLTKVHPQFRIFLSTNSNIEISPSICRHCIKAYIGEGSNLKTTISSIINLIGEYDNISNKIFRKILFASAFVHSLLLSRFNSVSNYYISTPHILLTDFMFIYKLISSLLNSQDGVPWVIIRNSLIESIYGNQLHMYQKNAISVIINQFIQQKVLADGYFFDHEKHYPSIQNNNESITQTIEQYPENDKLDIIGFCEASKFFYNADISQDIIESFSTLRPEASFIRNNVSIFISNLEGFLNQIPHEINTGEFNESDSLTSSFILNEVGLYNSLILFARKSIQKLISINKGMENSDIESNKEAESIINNQIPTSWEEISFITSKPFDQWFTELAYRVNYIQRWVTNGTPNAFNLSYLFSPQLLLLSTLMSYSSKIKNLSSSTTFEVRPLSTKPEFISEVPREGIIVYGLFFDKARWDEAQHCLSECIIPNRYNPCPVLHLIPRIDYIPMPNEFLCPVFHTSDRCKSNDYITSFGISSSEIPEKWVLNDTALVLSHP